MTIPQHCVPLAGVKPGGGAGDSMSCPLECLKAPKSQNKRGDALQKRYSSFTAMRIERKNFKSCEVISNSPEDSDSVRRAGSGPASR
jgi:hypothetical protein